MTNPNSTQSRSFANARAFIRAGVLRSIFAAGLSVTLSASFSSTCAQSQDVFPQQPQPSAVATAPVSLTLKRAIELALQNSKDLQVAKLQTTLADRSAYITKSQFLPNVYAGSGAGYTFGIPETPGGRAPALFSVTYTEQVINEPLRGQ